ncbi:DNA-3-methyladenine glycosylase [Aminipila butyrica]|uniref:Putative 3-methyladenine DNA glycosylase n=1 Tax=Aminipila butyrica TaxID=433296 RepID=A0A858BT46_9FIRM|nr:DNA-3-methyladenine glycosylase [Aminipila butyrica]QIB68737.1 DNA-3-methyladenine glycosylase [Aminipila butyrica]
MKKLSREFYNRDSILVAQDLLGKVLVHQVGGQRLAARIVETEAYMGVIDKAAHSYGGRRTARVEVMYGKPGLTYVFFIYGMYHCFNVVTREEGNPQAVLVRALEPVEGMDQMALNRFVKPYEQLSKAQVKGLTNGPGKLCRALVIDKSCNGTDLCGNTLYLAERPADSFEIVAAKRIGIDYAEEAKDYLWRFYIKGNPYVSVK